MPDPLEDLIERFRQAGCQNPESWASSENKEKLPQFARFVFLRELWKCAIQPGSREWLRTLDLPNDDGVGGVKRRLKESTASIEDLTALVRAAQVDVVRNVAFLLDCCSADQAEIQWGLFELDESHQPIHALEGLHESVSDGDIPNAEPLD